VQEKEKERFTPENSIPCIAAILSFKRRRLQCIAIPVKATLQKV